MCLKKNKTTVERARADHYVTDRGVLFRKVGRMNGMYPYGVEVQATMQYKLIKTVHALSFVEHKRERKRYKG